MLRYGLIALSIFVMAGCGHIAREGNSTVLQNQVDALDMAVLDNQKMPVAALGAYRDIYYDYTASPIAAAAYADALRRAQNPRKAADILKPFVLGRGVTNVHDAVFMAYMRLLLDQGFYKEALERLHARLKATPFGANTTATRPQMLHLQGIALAGQGRKTEATALFKQALKNWDGRPGIIEQNLKRLSQL